MKKLSLKILSLLIIGFLLNSCKTHTTVLKRHYMKGYYVSHKNNSVKNKERSESTSKHVFHSAKTVKEESRDMVANKDVLSASNEGVLFQTEKDQPGSNYHQKQKQHAIVYHNYNLAAIKHDPRPTKILPIEPERIMADTVTRDGLSLFWIVVLVILILWALGLLAGGFGLGGLINILLAIALILLILWLLRIV